MKTLQVNVQDKVARYRQRDGVIICGNSDYLIKFTFDSEWDAFPQKTARFIWDGQYVDVDFTGDECAVPILQNTELVRVGVYAGELCTTTPAFIECKKSILCDGAEASEEERERQADRAEAAADRAEEAAERAEETAGTAGKDGRGIVSITEAQSGTDENGRPWKEYKIDYTDGTFSYFVVTDGKDGADGNGIASIKKILTYEDTDGRTVNEYEITFTDGGAFTFDVKDGKDGAKGDAGISPHIGEDGYWYVGETSTGVKAQGEQGEQGEKGEQGIQGEQGEKGDDGADYILTEADKAEIVNAVLAAIPQAEEVSF